MTVSTFHAARSFTMDFYFATTPDPDVHSVGQIYTGPNKVHQRAAVHTFDLASVPAEGPPLPANAIIDLAELLANVTSVLGPAWTFIVAALADDRSAYDNQDATWNQYDAGLTWRLVAGDDAATPAPVTAATPDFIGDGLVTDALAPFVADAQTRPGRLLQLRYRITPDPGVTHSYSLKCTPADDADVTRLRITWRDPIAASIEHPEGVTLPGERPSAPAAAASAGRVSSPARPAPPARTRKP